MQFRKLFVAIALSTALMLTGCSDGGANSSESARVRYAKIYNPDGTLLVEGECTKAQMGRAYGYASIEIDGVTYDTGLDNVIVISWYE